MAGMARTARPPTLGGARTVIGVLDADRHASVDPRGRVHLDGEPWALDWWIGAEDRWHLASEEASVRQVLLGSTPVVETRVRVPSGDAVHRVFAARDAAGAAVVVVEVENASKVPFAVALAVRGPGFDGRGAVKEVSAEGTEVRVDGRLVLLAARAPGRRVAATAADGGVADVVLSGGAQPEAAVGARCREGQAQAAVVFPLAHTASLRVVLPLEAGALDVDALPSAEQVASGWRAHARRGARVQLPDRRLQEAVDASICHLLLRPQGLRVAAALSRYGFADEAARTLLGDPATWASRNAPGEALLALAAHWSLTHDEVFAERAVPLVASLVRSLGRSGSDEDLSLGAIASGAAAGMLAAAGEARGADDVRRAGEAMAASSSGRPAPAPTGVEPLLGMLATGSPTLTWIGPEDGHDLDVNAALLVGVRALLVTEVDGPEPGLRLCPHVPPEWLGQGWEAHDLPTASGRFSYAVRWHGDRPALLWELEPWPGGRPVRISAPGLDPTWSTTDAKGDALLAPVALPEPDPARGVRTAVTIDPMPPRRSA